MPPTLTRPADVVAAGPRRRRLGASPGLALARAELRMLGHWIASARHEPKLKIAVVSLAAIGLWIGAFLLSRSAFRWLVLLGDDLLPGVSLRLDDLVMARLLSGFSLALFTLLVVSNLLVSFAAFFRARDAPFLLATPLPLDSYFWNRFAKCTAFTSWSSLYLGAPVLIAYGLESAAPAGYYWTAVAFAAPFVTLPCALGVLACLALVRLTAALPRKVLGAAMALVALALLALFRGLAPDLAGEAGLGAVLRLVAARQNPFLPSSWFAGGVLAASRGQQQEVLFQLLLLSANALAATRLAAAAHRRFFWPAREALCAGERRARARRGRRHPLAAHPLVALSLKDLRTFWRDPSQWSQFAILFGVLALYAANMRSQSPAYDPQFWRGFVTLLNSAASLLVLATLTTRFVFPLLSLEGRRFWLLRLSPLRIEQLVWQKTLLSIVVTAPFSLGLTILSGRRLGLPFADLLLSLAFAGLATVALSGLAVGLGGIYPSFDVDSPARIVSGLGGTLTFIASLTYVLLVTVALGVALDWPALVGFLPGEASRAVRSGAALGFAVVLSAVAGWWPVRLGARSLRARE